MDDYTILSGREYNMSLHINYSLVLITCKKGNPVFIYDTGKEQVFGMGLMHPGRPGSCPDFSAWINALVLTIEQIYIIKSVFPEPYPEGLLC